MTSLLLGLLVGCAHPSPANADEAPTMDRRMRPEPKRTFVDGVALFPKDELRRWLERQVDAKGKPRRVRLPVVVTLHVAGIDRRGFVGNEQGLVLRLDDSAMGVGLADHARRNGDGGMTSTLLLDGVLVGDDGFRVLWIAKLEGRVPGVAQVEVVQD
ncbi:MAG: hypothetical protein IAE78_03210 [Myxococcus sp.]|nr:hypothetical protein [Myxococcus sp.]